MLPFQKPELISFVYALLPGFVTAWIFYGLTAYAKPSTFERIIQALVFTIFAECFARVNGIVLCWLGPQTLMFGPWTEDVHFSWKVLFAICMGFAAAVIANNNLLRLLPKWLTRKTSYPSEWFSAFSRTKCYIYLHLTGERRLYGWAEEWPDDPSKGHFVMMEPEWILPNNKRIPLPTTERMLIAATEVVSVEFEKECLDETLDLAALEVSVCEVVAYNLSIDKGKDIPSENDYGKASQKQGNPLLLSEKFID